MISQGSIMLLLFSPDRYLWTKPLRGFGGEAIEHGFCFQYKEQEP
jgi:hypothetical protein